MRADFEQAILDDLNNPEPFLIFADWLIEQGDPRGEFIHVQCKLEEENLTADERTKLRHQEKALWKQHGPTWLGELQKIVPNHDSEHRSYQPEITYRRGFLYKIEAPELTADLAFEIKFNTDMRFLQELSIQDHAYLEDDETLGSRTVPVDAETSFDLLIECQTLPNLRKLSLGEDEEVTHFNCNEQLASLVANMPNIQELNILCHHVGTDELFSLPMPHLRRLMVYHDMDYPLSILADNSSLTNLERLDLKPHALEYGDEPYLNLESIEALVQSPYLKKLQELSLQLCNAGDAGIRALVGSPLFQQLRVLDLSLGTITDDGAAILAQFLPSSSLQHVNLSSNLMSPAGVAQLNRTGITVDASSQVELDHGEFHYEGDME